MTERTLLPMTTGIERIYRRTPDGMYQEFYQHWVYFLYPDGSKTSKLDKVWKGKLYKVAGPRDIGFNGVVSYEDPETGQTLRLVAVSA